MNRICQPDACEFLSTDVAQEYRWTVCPPAEKPVTTTELTFGNMFRAVAAITTASKHPNELVYRTGIGELSAADIQFESAQYALTAVGLLVVLCH